MHARARLPQARHWRPGSLHRHESHWSWRKSERRPVSNQEAARAAPCRMLERPRNPVPHEHPDRCRDRLLPVRPALRRRRQEAAEPNSMLRQRSARISRILVCGSCSLPCVASSLTVEDYHSAPGFWARAITASHLKSNANADFSVCRNSGRHGHHGGGAPSKCCQLRPVASPLFYSATELQSAPSLAPIETPLLKIPASRTGYSPWRKPGACLS